MESEQRVIIRFLHREDVATDEIHWRLQAQFEDASYSLRTVRRWRQDVRQGRKDVHDEPRSGRPPIDFLDTKILACLEKEPFHSAYSLAEVLHVSHSTILNHLHDSLRVKIFHLGWIPHELTNKLRDIRIEECRELLPMLAGLEKGNCCSLGTRDGGYFTLQFRHSAKWTVSRNVPQNVRSLIATSKFMFTVMWGVDGFHLVNLMTSQEMLNSQYFIDNVLTHLLPKIFPQVRQWHALRLHCHLDSCRFYLSIASEQFFH
jgi:hypothetical protein